MNIILLLSGKQGSGKTTLANMINTWANTHIGGLLCYRIKFADPLYSMQDAMSEALQKYNRTMRKPDGTLLQSLGDWGRRQDPEYFVKIAQEQVGFILNRDTLYRSNRLILIDDARFVNEIQAFDNLTDNARVVTVRLEAPEHVRQVRAEKWRPNTNHASEIGLDHYEDWDRIIFTDTTSAIDALNSLTSYLKDIYDRKII